MRRERVSRVFAVWAFVLMLVVGLWVGQARAGVYHIGDFSPATLQQVVNTLTTGNHHVIVDSEITSDDVEIPSNITVEVVQGGKITPANTGSDIIFHSFKGWDGLCFGSGADRGRGILFVNGAVKETLLNWFGSFGNAIERAFRSTLKEESATVGITGATKANPCEINTENLGLQDHGRHGLYTGDLVMIRSVGGMTQLNDKVHMVTVVDDYKFQLDGVDSSSYGTYTSGGTITIYHHANADVPSNMTFKGLPGSTFTISSTVEADLGNDAEIIVDGVTFGGTYNGLWFNLFSDGSFTEIVSGIDEMGEEDPCAPGTNAHKQLDRVSWRGGIFEFAKDQPATNNWQASVAMDARLIRQFTLKNARFVGFGIGLSLAKNELPLIQDCTFWNNRYHGIAVTDAQPDNNFTQTGHIRRCRFGHNMYEGDAGNNCSLYPSYWGDSDIYFTRKMRDFVVEGCSFKGYKNNAHIHVQDYGSNVYPINLTFRTNHFEGLKSILIGGVSHDEVAIKLEHITTPTVGTEYRGVHLLNNGFNFAGDGGKVLEAHNVHTLNLRENPVHWTVGNPSKVWDLYSCDGVRIGGNYYGNPSYVGILSTTNMLSSAVTVEENETETINNPLTGISALNSQVAGLTKDVNTLESDLFIEQTTTSNHISATGTAVHGLGNASTKSVGVANGVASLDASGLVAQNPASAQIAGGVAGKIPISNGNGTLNDSWVGLGPASSITATLTALGHTNPTTQDFSMGGGTQTTGFPTPWGFSSADEFRTCMKVIRNTQLRTDDLETRLKTLGLLQ